MQQKIDPSQINLDGFVLDNEVLTERNFKDWITNYIDALFAERYKVFFESKIERKDLKELANYCIDSIKNNLLDIRLPNHTYELNDIRTLPHSPNYIIIVKQIQGNKEKGTTDSTEIFGLPEFYDEDGNVIKEPVGKTFVDGEITWEIVNRKVDYSKASGGTITLNGDVEGSVKNFNPTKTNNIITTTLKRGTDVILDGNTTVSGTLNEEGEGSHIVVTKRHENSVRTQVDQEVNSIGFQIGDDTILCDTTLDNTVSVRGNENGNPDEGGVAFGEWCRTGVYGNKNTLVLKVPADGSIYPSSPVGLGTEEHPFGIIHAVKVDCPDYNIEILSNAYPVGSIYMSFDDTNPKQLFGGEWEEITGTLTLLIEDSNILTNDTVIYVWRRLS